MTQLVKVDARLLAIARGEIEPDPSREDSTRPEIETEDPFGGLILVEDEDQAAHLKGIEPEPFSIRTS